MQLRAQNESTVEVLKAINRTNVYEKVFYVLLILQAVNLGAIPMMTPSVSSILNDNGKEASHEISIALYTIQVVFVIFFCLQMLHVNKQFSLFFKQVGIESYPTKTMTAVLLGYLFATINANVSLILYIKKLKILYLNASAGLINIAYRTI